MRFGRRKHRSRPHRNYLSPLGPGEPWSPLSPPPEDEHLDDGHSSRDPHESVSHSSNTSDLTPFSLD